MIIMRFYKKILFWTLGLAVLLMGGVFGMVVWGMRSTTGPRVETYPTPRSALLVIDVQEDYTGPQAKKKYKDGDRIVAASNVLLEQAQANGVLVVYIENVISNPIISILTGGINAPGSPGIATDRRIKKIAGARTFSKGLSDSFSNPNLDTYLRQNHVNRVFLTGLDAAYCVNATAQGALNRGYKVVLFPEALATETRKSINELSADWQKAGALVKTDLRF
jgi:nicotinamidase-related amidase